MAKRIGLLFGEEQGFVDALAAGLGRMAGDGVAVEAILTSAGRLDEAFRQDLILDRVGHRVPFYRALLKRSVLDGAQVVNNPFWSAADDRYFALGVASACGLAVPRTVLLPHKERPAGTNAASFPNLRYPLPWDEVFGFVGFPLVLRPLTGEGQSAYCPDRQAFFAAYDRSGTTCQIAQQALEGFARVRVLVVGREQVRTLDPVAADLQGEMEQAALALSRALGYDLAATTFAVREEAWSVLEAADGCPDLEEDALGPDSFAWAVEQVAAFVLHRLREPRPAEFTGAWTERLAEGFPPSFLSAAW